MEFFTETSISIMSKIGFTPIVLIGLLIATLSLILNLKTTNIYIQNFKKHKNIYKFINLIFYTSFSLLLMLSISIVSQYFTNIYTQFICSIIFILILCFLLYSLFTIVFILKEIVKISLKDE